MTEAPRTVPGAIRDWVRPRLRSLPDRWDIGRRRLVGALRGKPVAHFIHVGKTGGTAMKAALRTAPDAGAYTLFVWGHFQTLRRVPRGEKVVFFLRDPVSKFVSGFNYRQREARPHFHIPWRAGEVLAFRRFQSPGELARALSSDDPALRAEAVAAMGAIHQVKDSVFRWFESEDYFRERLDDVLFIGFQDRLADDFEALKRALGLPQTLALPGEDDSRYQKSLSQAEPLDALAVANLTAWYAADIRFYDFCRRFADARAASDGA